MLLQIFIGIVEEFEEVGGFGSGESSCGGIVLVGVILARLQRNQYDLNLQQVQAEENIHITRT